MKSPVAYYLLLLYITVMLKPLVPVVGDALAHTFNEAIHIGTVHAIYGSNHLAMAVASTASESNNKNQTMPRYEESVPLHIIHQSASAFLCSISIDALFSFFTEKKCIPVYLSVQLPPPRFLL